MNIFQFNQQQTHQQDQLQNQQEKQTKQEDQKGTQLSPNNHNHLTLMHKQKPIRPINILNNTNLNQLLLDTKLQQYLHLKTTKENPNHDPSLPFLPTIPKCKQSQRPIGLISCYCTNTHQGLFRRYNEDRVSIVLNMIPPNNYSQNAKWPQCSMFGIFDGHGGSQCAEYLRDNLHLLLIQQSCFPKNPGMALKMAILQAEREFLDIAIKKEPVEKSGSCAVVLLIVEHILVVASVGDSRAFIVKNEGQCIVELTQDHKPSLESERKRILQNGGKVYQSQTQYSNGVIGPMRVFPGRLSVSRAIGDIEAKEPKFGGIKDVISAEPSVKIINLIEDQYEFLFMACDGIFDRLSNQEIVKLSFISYIEQKPDSLANSNEFLRIAVESIMTQSFIRRTTDNVTILMLGFNNLQLLLPKLKYKDQIYKMQIKNQNFQQDLVQDEQKII